MKPFCHFAGTAKRLVRDDSGAALLLTLAVFLLLFILVCGVFSVGEAIRQKVELQNACDAAAYSAAVVQADGLSRMAVVNRALAWSYIQLSRAQMDYIVYRWLKLTCKRFHADKMKNARPGGLLALRYCFVPRELGLYNIHKILENALRWIPHRVWIPVFRCYGCHHDSKEAGPGWYVGLPDTPGEVHGRGLERVRLNDRDEYTIIDNGKTGKDRDGLEPLLEKLEGWAQNQEKLIDHLKGTIRELNDTLMVLQVQMNVSMAATAESVVKAHLPKKADGSLDEEAAKDFYWMAAGGACGIPAEYGGETNSYFAGLVNTEEDELQFLSMAGGVPPRRDDAPAWMKGRPVYLSDYFGAGDNPTEPARQLQRYVAGGLDQWYVRGSKTESANSSSLVVPKQLEAGHPEFEGGIRRVYKNANRAEGYTEKIVQQYYRPNHVFSGDIGAIKKIKLNEYVLFLNPKRIMEFVTEPVGGRAASRALSILGDIATMGWGALVDVLVNQAIEQAIDMLKEQVVDAIGEFLQQLQSRVSTAVFDIAPSASHQRIQYYDQCANVAERVSLVAEYEWASAYWFCFYWKMKKKHSFSFKDRPGTARHYRFPIREIFGCNRDILFRTGADHGYNKSGLPLGWLPDEIEHLFGGADGGGDSRKDYRSCFINLDGTRDYNYNTHLKGYARIYGDDAEIWDERWYVGEVAKPWVLRPEFFNGGAGTIVVGLARKQRNPFERLAETVERPSLYEPFTLKGSRGRERYMVALSAARAGYAPRPAKGDGTGTVNAGKDAPGTYEARFDRVCFQKMKLNPGGDVGRSRLGCACGNEGNTERLARAWNLSQTDWDAMLVPVRFALAEHTDYDSVEPSGSLWEFTDSKRNGTAATMDLIQGTLWHQAEGGGTAGYRDILAFPPAEKDGDDGDDGKRIKELLFRRKVL